MSDKPDETWVSDVWTLNLNGQAIAETWLDENGVVYTASSLTPVVVAIRPNGAVFIGAIVDGEFVPKASLVPSQPGNRESEHVN